MWNPTSDSFQSYLEKIWLGDVREILIWHVIVISEPDLDYVIICYANSPPDLEDISGFWEKTWIGYVRETLKTVWSYVNWNIWESYSKLSKLSEQIKSLIDPTTRVISRWKDWVKIPNFQFLYNSVDQYLKLINRIVKMKNRQSIYDELNLDEFHQCFICPWFNLGQTFQESKFLCDSSNSNRLGSSHSWKK